MPTVKEFVDELVLNTTDNKNHWKPKTMIPSIQKDKAGANKYSAFNPMKEEFAAYDWTCYTLEKIKTVLSTDKGGPYYQKSHDEEYLYTRAWSLIRFMRWNESASRKKKRTRPTSSAPPQPSSKRQKLAQAHEIIDLTDDNKETVHEMSSRITTRSCKTMASKGVATIDLIPTMHQDGTILSDDIGDALLEMVREPDDNEGDLENRS